MVTSESPYSYETFINGSIRYEHEKRILGKPCGIPSELADVVIRILDICGLYEWDIESFYNTNMIEYNARSFGSMIANLHLLLSHTYNAGDDTYKKDVITYMFATIKLVEYICTLHNIILEQIIQKKLEYNRTRGYKHGGKVI